jgi:hypothetical protein
VNPPVPDTLPRTGDALPALRPPRPGVSPRWERVPVLPMAIAVVLAVRWALVPPVMAIEGGSARQALRRSGGLTRGHWLKVASLVIVANGVVLIAGPLTGALLILVTNAPFAALNVVAGIIYAVAMPFVAITATYVYFDMRTRAELAEGDRTEALPAEIAIET